MHRDCVIFTGRTDAEGYGRQWDRATARTKYAHRLAFERAHGVQLTREQVLHHVCHTPACVNVEHLVLTTRWEHRSVYHKGQGPACPHGVSPRCLACQRAVNAARQLAFKARQRQAERCQQCLAPRYGSHRLCREHRERENARARRLRRRHPPD